MSGAATPLRSGPLGKLDFRVWRTEDGSGRFVDYSIDVQEGMVVLDAVHKIQAKQAPDLSVRWNCKAGKCGSCSAEVNGKPRLMCMTRIDTLDTSRPITVAPVKTFPGIKDLVTDVSWNYRVNKAIRPFTPGPMTAAEQAKGEFQMAQVDVDRAQEFRKCIECYLCQNVCHVLRDGGKMADPKTDGGFFGPRFMIRIAQLEMHPKDIGDRVPQLKHEGGVGLCNITKCCTEVCPENITITDNAIIPLKERVADRYYDPVRMLWAKVTGKK